MAKRIRHVVEVITAASLLAIFAGCAEGQASTRHEVVAAQSPGHAMACQKCYDRAVVSGVRAVFVRDGLVPRR